MRNLHIIMPMAGEGTRFSKEGYCVPKPLLKANGIPFFERAINSLCNIFDVLRDNLKFTFIVREEHIDKFYIDDIIKSRMDNFDYHIISVKHTTRGAVETCLLAEPYIEKNDSILIMDCDLCYSSRIYENLLMDCICLPDINVNAGVLLSFNSTDARYSYAVVNEHNIVERTAEKNPISNHALIGSYFFTYSEDFLGAAHKLIEENDVKQIKEYYVSLLYNYLINNNKTIRCVDVDTYDSFGTPEELINYENKCNNN